MSSHSSSIVEGCFNDSENDAAGKLEALDDIGKLREDETSVGGLLEFSVELLPVLFRFMLSGFFSTPLFECLSSPLDSELIEGIS